jgi:hypothetical protein
MSSTDNDNQDYELTEVNGMFAYSLTSSHPLKSHIHIPGVRTPRIEPDFGDSSWPIFNIYSKIAEEEDDKKVELWQKNAEGIIVFVCPSFFSFTTAVRTNRKATW